MKRILFVDDEPRILDGLQRMLRPWRKQWEMAFALGGEAALTQVEARPFDAIVSDMRMPGMDGAALLKRVQDACPQTVRIVLSGHTELEAVLRAVPVAHQYLTKPCDAATLREVIERAFSLQTLLEDVTLRRVAGQLGDLPSSPRLYNALTEALANSDVTLGEVARIVEQDVAMCAKCLQLVNSAFFGLARRITTMQEAISYLGTNTLRSLVFSAEAFRTFKPQGRVTAQSLAALEQHAFLSASIATRLLKDRHQAQEAFMAAMLHDIGKLVLAIGAPGQFEDILATAAERKLPLYEQERETLGVSHAEVGAYLLALWGVPYPIVEAVAYHHQPGRVAQGTFGVLGAVYVANALAHEPGIAPSGAANGAHAAFDTSYLAAVGVLDQLPAWRSMVEQLGATQEI